MCRVVMILFGGLIAFRQLNIEAIPIHACRWSTW